MLHNVAAAASPAAFVREPAKTEACGGIRLLGHGHGGAVDWSQTNDPCSPWVVLHNAWMALPASSMTRGYYKTNKSDGASARRNNALTSSVRLGQHPEKVM